MMWRTRREGSRDEALLAVLGERLRSAAARVRMRPGFQSSLRTWLTMEAVLGERLRGAAAQVSVRPDFQSSLRTSLIMEASTALVPDLSEPRAQPARTVRVMPRRRTTIVAAFVAAALGLGGMASASASALPGEGLYPIKRAAERVELVFHRDLADRGAFKLELAERRLAEARELAARGPEFDQLAAESVREFDEAAADATADLMAAYREDHTSASMVVLNEFTVRTDKALDALASQLPSEATALGDARERVEAIGSQSEELCPACGGGPEEGFAPPTDSDGSVEAAPEPEPEPPSPPAEPSLPVPPATTPSVTTSTSSPDEDDDEDEGDNEDDEEEEEETEDTDADEPEVATPTPTPTSSPEPSPTPTPTPTPEPTEPPVPPIPPLPTDPPSVLPEIIPETLEGVGQLIGGTLGGLSPNQD